MLTLYSNTYRLSVLPHACYLPPIGTPLSNPRGCEQQFPAGPHRKEILNSKQDSNFVTVQSALRAEVNHRDQIEKEERKQK